MMIEVLFSYAFPNGVEGRSPSTLGIDTKKGSNAVSVAISRRRYRSRKISRPMANATTPNIK